MLPPPRQIPDWTPRVADGRYILVSKLGRGGMAAVFAAWDQQIEHWRAVKVLLPKHANDRRLVTRFEREAQTMSALSHSNLVQVHEVGRHKNLPFIVMELIPCGTLRSWTRRFGIMPARLATLATIQLSRGLQAVHDAGVVHRDVKPHNLLVDASAVVKLTDFGIARTKGSGYTRTGYAMGTLGFMSPEQVHDAKSVDHRTDQYALGATFWTLLTGRRAQDLFRLKNQPELLDGIPGPLHPILSRCMAYDKNARYPSVAAVADALVQSLQQLPPDPPDAPELPIPPVAPNEYAPLGHPFSPPKRKQRPDNRGSASPPPQSLAQASPKSAGPGLIGQVWGYLVRRAPSSTQNSSGKRSASPSLQTLPAAVRMTPVPAARRSDLRWNARCWSCSSQDLAWTTLKRDRVPVDVLMCQTCEMVQADEDWDPPLGVLAMGHCWNCGRHRDVNHCPHCGLTKSEAQQAHDELRDLVSPNISYLEAARQAFRQNRRLLALKLATAAALSETGEPAESARAFRIWLLAAVGERQAALEDARGWVENTSAPSAAAWASYGQRLHDQQQGGAAVEAYERSLQQHPNQPLIRVHKALLLLDLGRTGQAQTELIHVLGSATLEGEVARIAAQVACRLCDTLAETDQNPEIERLLDGLASHASQNAGLLAHRARLEVLAGRPTPARRLWAKAHRLEPERPMVIKVQRMLLEQSKGSWW